MNKPTALKILQGAYDKDPQRRNHTEPTPAEGTPRMPSGFCAHEKTRWKFMCEQLAAMNLNTPANLPILEAYVRTWNRWRVAEERLREEGEVIVGSKGSVYLNPRWGVARSCLAECNKMLASLGFTPAARSSMHVVKADKKSTVMTRKRG